MKSIPPQNNEIISGQSFCDEMYIRLWSDMTSLYIFLGRI